MPTNQPTYNSRLTSEALEKRFRDTFTSQGGAELMDDLYAQGVIVPIVDFTAAAQGETLPEYLQTAWDASTSNATANNANTVVVNTTGFWLVNVSFSIDSLTTSSTGDIGQVNINTGITVKRIAGVKGVNVATPDTNVALAYPLTVFLDSGHSLEIRSFSTGVTVSASVRQIADINGNPTNPLGFTFS